MRNRLGRPRGVECYERLKAKGPTGAAAFILYATPLVYALTEQTTQDKIPLVASGLGRSDSSDGRVFPYIFPGPINWWSQNTAKIRFIGQRIGGMAQLKGLKIANIYHDSDYGRETLAILDHQAAQYGFTVQHLAVQPPGLDQKATWLRVQVAQPDWVILRSAGVMTPTALKEAAQVGFPRDKIVGPHGTCSEQDMVPAGEAAMGFICATWYGTGTHFPLIQDMLTYVYARGKGAGPDQDVGTGHWMRGLLRAFITTEGIPPGDARVREPAPDGGAGAVGASSTSPSRPPRSRRWGRRVAPPFTLSCRDHEGGGGMKFQQWDGKQWQRLTDWTATDQALVRPLVEASAAKYAQEKGLTLRDCP